MNLEEIKKQYPEVPVGNSLNYTDREIGYLHVLYKTSCSARHGTAWVCKCDCGNYTVKRTEALRMDIKVNKGTCGECGLGVTPKLNVKPPKNRVRPYGLTRSLVGQRFGRLTVVKDSGKRGHERVIWTCRCDCGNFKDVPSHYLIQEDVVSCGCTNSKNNIKIGQMLASTKMRFKPEYAPIGLNGKRFDFFVDNHYVVEYDGEQHFNYRGTNWSTKENLALTRQRDLEKNKYCFKNDIPIIRIPYDTEYTLDDLKLETTRFLLTPENEKEYYECRSKS